MKIDLFIISHYILNVNSFLKKSKQTFGFHDFGEGVVIVDFNETDFGEVDGFVVTAGSVVIADESDFVETNAVVFTVFFERVILIEGTGCHIEGGGTAYKYIVIREDIADFVIDSAAFNTVGVKSELVLDLCFRTDDREGYAAGFVILNVVACVFLEAVFFAAHGNAVFYALSVTGKNIVFNDIQGFGIGIVFAELQAVISDDVDGETAELIEDTHTSAGTCHEELILFGESEQSFVVGGFKGRFVLCQRTVKIKSNQFDHGKISFA